MSPDSWPCSRHVPGKLVERVAGGMAPKKLSGAKIARLSFLDLCAALDEWGVPYTKKDLTSELRGRLERKIVDSEAGTDDTCADTAGEDS